MKEEMRFTSSSGIFKAGLVVLLTVSTAWAAPGYGTRACVDEAGRTAFCTDDPGNWHECRAVDEFGRCPDDPICYNANGQTRCRVKWLQQLLDAVTVPPRHRSHRSRRAWRMEASLCCTPITNQSITTARSSASCHNGHRRRRETPL